MAFSEVILEFHGSKLQGSQELVYQEMLNYECLVIKTADITFQGHLVT